jgi:cytochrome b561
MQANVSTPSVQRYSGFAQAMHWTIAVVVLGMFTLGMLFDYTPKGTKTWWVNIHVCVGLVLFALVLIRLAYRAGNPPPPPPAGVSEPVRKAGVASHHLMYLLMVVIPVIGVVAYVWHGRVFNYGLFQLDFHVPSNKAVYERAEDIHGYLVYVLMGFVALHFLAALWHQFIRKDGLMWRMLPGGK